MRVACFHWLVFIMQEQKLAKGFNNLKFKRMITVNPPLSPLGGLFLSSTFKGGGGGLKREGGLNREGVLFNLTKRINESKLSRRWTCGYQALYCFF